MVLSQPLEAGIDPGEQPRSSDPVNQIIADISYGRERWKAVRTLL
jgi:hypothetical protein